MEGSTSTEQTNGQATEDMKKAAPQQDGEKVDRQQQAEEYKDLGEYVHKFDDVPVDKKHIPTFSCG